MMRMETRLFGCLLCFGVGCNASEPSAVPPQASGPAGAPAANAAPAVPAAGTSGPAPSTAGAGVVTPPSAAAGSSAPTLPASTAGTPAVPRSSTPGPSDPAQPPTTTPEVIDHHADIRGKCAGIDSGYPDDKACIPAPSPDEGIQIHVGPKDYKDADEVAKYLMQPGEESSECWTLVLPNEEEIVYQTSMLSGRPGTHHIINTLFAGGLTEGGFGRCADATAMSATPSIGSLPGASKAYMARSTVPPEYADVGRTIPAKATAQADMHYFNFTDKPIIREVWINIYFAKLEDIKREAQQIRGMGGFGWNQNPIAPGTDMVYKYECPVKGEGHLLNLLGHYHAHGKRFTASIRRATGETEKVFEMFDYLDPAVFEYNSVVTNPMFAEGSAGALSGQLAVHDGDTVLWECHVVNDSDVALRYVNEVKTGEMCNLWGASLGIEKLNCLRP